MAKEMPCNTFIRRRAENSFKKEYPTTVSAECIEWLAWIETSTGISIQHAKNGQEYQAGKKRRAVDGYCRLVYAAVYAIFTVYCFNKTYK